MKKRKNLLFILVLTIFSTNIVKAECTTEEEEIWLLRHGCEIEIDYAPICLVVMRKGQLLHHLHKEQLDYKTYRGCLLIINNFIMMLDRYYIGNSDPTYIDISGIDSKTLISELLRHAERYDKTLLT